MVDHVNQHVSESKLTRDSGDAGSASQSTSPDPRRRQKEEGEASRDVQRRQPTPVVRSHRSPMRSGPRLAGDVLSEMVGRVKSTSRHCSPAEPRSVAALGASEAYPFRQQPSRKSLGVPPPRCRSIADLITDIDGNLAAVLTPSRGSLEEAEPEVDPEPHAADRAAGAAPPRVAADHADHTATRVQRPQDSEDIDSHLAPTQPRDSLNMTLQGLKGEMKVLLDQFGGATGGGLYGEKCAVNVPTSMQPSCASASVPPNGGSARVPPREVVATSSNINLNMRDFVVEEDAQPIEFLDDARWSARLAETPFNQHQVAHDKVEKASYSVAVQEPCKGVEVVDLGDDGTISRSRTESAVSSCSAPHEACMNDGNEPVQMYVAASGDSSSRVSDETSSTLVSGSTPVSEASTRSTPVRSTSWRQEALGGHAQAPVQVDPSRIVIRPSRPIALQTKKIADATAAVRVEKRLDKSKGKWK